jgi:hypothetical protein
MLKSKAWFGLIYKHINYEISKYLVIKKDRRTNKWLILNCLEKFSLRYKNEMSNLKSLSAIT